MAIDFNSIMTQAFSKDRFVKACFFVGILVNILLWLWLGFNFRNLSDTVFLHYSIYFGIDLIGPWYQILFIPLLGMVLFAVNFALGFVFYKIEKMLGYFLVASAAFFQFVLLLASFFIISVNF